MNRPDDPTRTGRIGLDLVTAAAVAVTLAASWLASCTTEAREPQRWVMFVSYDHDRARAAFARFEATYRAMGIEERQRARLKFVGVDLEDEVAVRKVLDKGIAKGAAAIVAPAAALAVEAMRRTKTVPVVFATHEDPVQLNLAASLVERPANLAGISFDLRVEAKMLELLREVAPGARRIGYIVDRDVAATAGVTEFLEASRRHGIEWKVIFVDSIDQLESNLRNAGAVDAWFVTKARAVEEHREQFIAALSATRLPAIYPSQRDAEAGGALAYEAVFDDPMGAIARQLDRVLSGVRPSDIPIERPKRFSLSINVNAARAAGMKLSPALLARADHVL